jgi:hypothetical protein
VFQLGAAGTGQPQSVEKQPERFSPWVPGEAEFEIADRPHTDGSQIRQLPLSHAGASARSLQ